MERTNGNTCGRVRLAQPDHYERELRIERQLLHRVAMQLCLPEVNVAWARTLERVLLRATYQRRSDAIVANYQAQLRAGAG